MLMITSKSLAPDSVNLYSVDFLSLLIGIFLELHGLQVPSVFEIKV